MSRTLRLNTLSLISALQRRLKDLSLLVIIKQGEDSYGASSPDLPGCVVVGATREEVEKNMQETIEMHIQGMIEDNEPIPVSHNSAEYVNVASPTSAA